MFNIARKLKVTEIKLYTHKKESNTSLSFSV